MSNTIPFCKKCGSILEVRHVLDRLYGICKCGNTQELHNTFSFGQKVHHAPALGKGVVREAVEKGFPHECKKCGFDECEIIDLGCAYADESNIYLYKCKKCNHVERQADGTGNS